MQTEFILLNYFNNIFRIYVISIFYFLFSFITETEFLVIAEKLKPHVERRMKIEPFPWLRDYYVDMNKLYTELILEKLENELLGEKVRILLQYKDIFSSNGRGKILIKGDPSSGSSGRVRGGPRNMKSMRPPSVAIFFMTYFYRARGGMAPSAPPGSPSGSGNGENHPREESWVGLGEGRLQVVFNGFLCFLEICTAR